MPFSITTRTPYSLDDFQQAYKDLMKPGRITGEVLNSLRKTGTRIKNQLERTTNEWENHTVNWKRGSPTTVGGGVGITIEATGDGAEIWQILDRGTEKKYGKPEDPDNYSPKTRPRTFSSSFGIGRWIFDPNYKSDGIIAREWTQAIQNDPILQQFFADDFEDRMERLLNSGRAL